MKNSVLDLKNLGSQFQEALYAVGGGKALSKVLKQDGKAPTAAEDDSWNGLNAQ